MATVRIYRVAELLNTSSQEVMALLKRDHGIEVRSASSTIEEVVARQFVDRLARQRNISVPSNTSFADVPAAVKGRKASGKTPEPARPAAPSLPPPRLVKSAKPPVTATEPLMAPPADAESVLVPPPGPVPFSDQELVAEEPVVMPAGDAPAPEPVYDEPVIAARASEAAVEPEEPESAPGPAASSRLAAVPPSARPVMPPPTGHVVPPTLRLRVEDPRTGQAPQ